MIAYNNNWLHNLQVQQQVQEAAEANCITKEEQTACTLRYPVGFYTPNIFIRIGLFILTVVIAFFSVGLFALSMLDNNGEKTFGILLLLFSCGAYVVLEWMVRQKHHYKSGADDALLWVTGTGMLSSLNLLIHLSAAANAIIVCILALYFLIRFANALMGILVPLAMLAIVFFSGENVSDLAKAFTPILILLLSAATYFVAHYLIKQNTFRLYEAPLTSMKVTALICGYVSVNYYAVREASVGLLHVQLSEGAGIPYGWLFWLFTVCIPLFYIFSGIVNKDVIFLRSGLVLVAAIVFTVRYYYSVAPIEVAMTAGGILLVAVGYMLIKYLRQPKYGFTSAEISTKKMTGKLAIEALIVAETFTAAQPADNNTNYGGGSFGGGGASGDF